jgi:glycosyltransferase involved in cell wall biosynthesis
VGTAIGADLIRRLGVPVAAIIGGSHTDRWLSRCDIALTENPEQERFLKPRMGDHRLMRLPKLVSPAFSGDWRNEAAEFDLAVVGRFERHKNHEALKPLFDHDLSIAFVGDGSLRPDLEAYARTRRARVTFTGFVAPDDVASILQRSRILVHPSRSEGFPRAVVEAMASGTPAVCLKGVVGWPLVSGENSLLVEEDQLTQHVLDLLADTDRLERLSHRSAETFSREFSMMALREAAKELTEKIDEAVLKSSRGTALVHIAWALRFMVMDGPRYAVLGLRRLAARLLRRMQPSTSR